MTGVLLKVPEKNNLPLSLLLRGTSGTEDQYSYIYLLHKGGGHSSLKGIGNPSLKLQRNFPFSSCSKLFGQKHSPGISLVVQWLRIHLPMHGTQV